MRMRLFVGLMAAGAFVALCGQVSAQSRSQRPKVAVMDFDYGAIHHWWGGQYDIGKGMADQVVDALVNDGTFRVIERKRLDTVLAEQDFARSDRADPDAAKMSKIGRVLGVKYIIAGSITKFSMEQKGGGLRVKGIGLGGGGAKAEVRLTARMIDTTTAEIMISAVGNGSSKRGTGISFSKGGTALDMGSNEFRDSALGDAQQKACEELVKQFVARADRLEE
jgi:curli biogenesis system outer membrane secretion channel CsgG